MMKKNMKILDWIAFVLVVVGALNWGLVGLVDFNLVSTLFGAGTMITKGVYILVGLAGIWMLFCCATKCCKGGGSSSS